MQGFPWFRFALLSTGLVGAGYMLMKATVPTPEQTYNALSPDLRKRVDANRAARLAQEDAMRKQVQAQTSEAADPDTAKPVWASTSKK